MTMMPLLLAVSISAANRSNEPASAAPEVAETQKTFLVTGASSGFGRRITERLAADGHFVYAGARKDGDIAALSAIPNVKGLRLDVTKPADIAVAVQTVTADGRALHGLVNNAGVYSGGPLPLLTDAEFQYVMDVNGLGVLRVTRAFLPLIKASKGRIVNIGSMAGLFGYPNGALYTMSKHAVEAFTDSIAAELAPAGVSVSVVEPGNYRTEIGANFVKHLKQSAADPQFVAAVEERTKTKAQDKDPEEVALAVKRALLDAKPQRRYFVPPNKKEADLVIQAQVARLVQLNQNQPYAYSRDELVTLLDATLAQAKPRADAKPQPEVKSLAEVKAAPLIRSTVLHRGSVSVPPL